jgi:hypothetical protein
MRTIKNNKHSEAVKELNIVREYLYNSQTLLEETRIKLSNVLFAYEDNLENDVYNNIKIAELKKAISTYKNQIKNYSEEIHELKKRIYLAQNSYSKEMERKIMYKIKNMKIKMTYYISLDDIKVPIDIYEALLENVGEELSSNCIEQTEQQDKVVEWLNDNTDEVLDTENFEYEIESIK